MRFLTALVVLATTAVAQQCYYPAGNPSNDVPCGSTGSCCPSKSQCLSNGLCAISGNQFQRSSCTDKSWGSSCFQQCYKTSYPGSPWTNTANVFICGGASPSSAASYCCETAIDQGTGCCSGSTFNLQAGTPASQPSTSAAKPAVFLQQSTTSSSASVTTISTTSSTTTTSSSSSTYTSTSYYIANTTTSIGATGSIGMPSPSANGTLVGGSTPTAPGGSTTTHTGAAAKVGQSFVGLVVFAVAGWIVL